MKILSVDTSGPVCGVAILSDDSIIYECSVVNKLTHSTNLMPMIDNALALSNLTLHDLDRIAVVTGPGSFTGVRIGVSTVKGLCHGSALPCVTVDALEAMAAGIGTFNGVVCPIQDARAGQVYGAAFSCTDGKITRLMDDIPLKLEEYIEAVSSFGDRFLFLGDGMPVHRGKLTSMLGDRAVFAEPQFAFLRPASVAKLGSLKSDLLQWKELEPMYLRAPNAERCKKLVEAARE